jgi:hypothetical protein
MRASQIEDIYWRLASSKLASLSLLKDDHIYLSSPRYLYALSTYLIPYHLLLTLPHCDPSCCPQAPPPITILKLPPYRADCIMSDQVTPEVNSAADLARLRSEGRLLNSQELKELNTKVKALEEMARLEDRLRILENRKRSYPNDISRGLEISESPRNSGPAYHTRRREDELPSPRNQMSGQRSSIRPSIELDGSESSSSEEIQHQHKRRRYTKGIKITPSYTLKVSSSLREWGDWKRDIERVFEGDPDTYHKGTQKILKALDYLDTSLKSLWYTYSEQYEDVRKWPVFLKWTRDNIQNGQNAIATLYEQQNAARQLPEQSPIQFNAYLAAIERDLPQQAEAASAMMFYSKLSRELKRQFKTSDIPIPETRAECVAVAQRVWEGLYGSNAYKANKEPVKPSSGSNRLYRSESDRNRRDQHRSEHRSRGEHGKDKPKSDIRREQPTCFNCNKPGHYATACPEKKKGYPDKKARIQALQKDCSSPNSSRNGSEQPPSQTEPEDNNDSDDSLN